MGIARQANVIGCIPSILSEVNEGTIAKVVSKGKPNEAQRCETKAPTHGTSVDRKAIDWVLINDRFSFNVAHPTAMIHKLLSVRLNRL